MKKTTLLLLLLLAIVSNVNAQFTQNFDGGGSSIALPAGWTGINGGSSNTWYVNTPLYVGAHSGTKAAMIPASSATTPHDDYLITPPITVVAGVNDRLTYWSAYSSTGYVETYDVKISKTGVNAADFTDYAVQTNYGFQFYTQKSINLSAYVGQTIYVAFHATSPVNSIGFSIDDVVNDAFPACSPTAPFTQDFEISATTSSNGDFPGCWTSVNSPNVNALWWNPNNQTNSHSGQYIAYTYYTPATGMNNYLVSPKITVVAGVNDRFSFWARSFSTTNKYLKVRVSTTTPTVNGFTTTLATFGFKDVYNKVTLDLSAYVGQSIYIGLVSQEAAACSFAVEDVVSDAMPVAPDFPQSFENANNLPVRWRTLNPSGTQPWSINSTVANAHTGTNSAQMNHTQAAQNDILVSPPIFVTTGVNDRLTYWMKSNNSTYNQLIVVGASTVVNPTAANFTTIHSNYNNTFWRKESVDLSAYAGQSVTLSFKCTSPVTSTTIYLDDFATDRLIPALHSDCQGIYNLTTRIPNLLNGQSASDNVVTFYMNENDALTGTNPIVNTTAYNIFSNSPITLYARIYNTVASTYTIKYFSLISDKITFQFQVSQVNVLASGFPSGSDIALQWSDNNGVLANETGPVLNLQDYPSSYYFNLTATNTATNCVAGSQNIYFPHFFPDVFTVSVSSGQETTTPSVFANDILPFTFFASPANANPGINITDSGTITIAAGTPPGTYIIPYHYNGNNSDGVYYQDTLFATVIIPQTGIEMNCFIDTNNNGVKDIGEQAFLKGQFHYVLNDNGVVNNLTSSLGRVTIYDTNFSNSYDLSYTINTEYAPYFSIATPSVSNVVINGFGFQMVNFPITVLQAYVDLTVTLSPSNLPRPGFTYTNRITYTNNGNLTMASGTVYFTANPGLTITNISQAGTTATANGFSYNFTNLNPDESRYIGVTMQVPTIPTVSLGQLLTNTASITNPVADVVPTDNSSSLTQTIVGSYDPNSKAESHGEKIVQSSFTANDYLTYTILFENTGTASAINVQVNDVLDAKLDETSVRMISASNNYVLDRIGNSLVWKFNNINLPPSVANTLIGHGYIVFKVKPKSGYVVGDIIPNTANIYFDFNPAILTNTFSTQFIQSLNTTGFAFSHLNCYPNPVTNTLTVSNDTPMDTIEIISVLGQTLNSIKPNDLQAQVDVSGLNPGIYFVKISAGQQEKTIKIVKE